MHIGEHVHREEWLKEHLTTWENAHDSFSEKWKLWIGYIVGPQLWRGHTPLKGNWQSLSGSWLLNGCHLFLFTFLCFPSFQQWPCLTSIGKTNLNKLKTKQNKRWLVWQRYVCNKNYTPDQYKQHKETELEKCGETGWLVGKRSNPNRLWLGTDAETLHLPAVLYKWSRIG